MTDGKRWNVLSLLACSRARHPNEKKKKIQKSSYKLRGFTSCCAQHTAFLLLDLRHLRMRFGVLSFDLPLVNDDVLLPIPGFSEVLTLPYWKGSQEGYDAATEVFQEESPPHHRIAEKEEVLHTCHLHDTRQKEVDHPPSMITRLTNWWCFDRILELPAGRREPRWSNRLQHSIPVRPHPKRSPCPNSVTSLCLFPKKKQEPNDGRKRKQQNEREEPESRHIAQPVTSGLLPPDANTKKLTPPSIHITDSDSRRGRQDPGSR